MTCTTNARVKTGILVDGSCHVVFLFGFLFTKSVDDDAFFQISDDVSG